MLRIIKLILKESLVHLNYRYLISIPRYEVIYNQPVIVIVNYFEVEFVILVRQQLDVLNTIQKG